MISKPTLESICNTLKEKGATVYYCGGYVRDYVMQIESKDIDLEVYNIPINNFENIMLESGGTKAGNDFPVYFVPTSDSGDVQFALPRIEVSTGMGYKDFSIFCDPFADTIDACERRDLTVNAMLMNYFSGEIVDHFDGQKHIEEKLLVNVAYFGDDPIRVFRVFKFALRYGFAISQELKKELITCVSQIEKSARVLIELDKLFGEFEHHSYETFCEVMNTMYKVGLIKFISPELDRSWNLESKTKYHNETVGEHVCYMLAYYTRNRNKWSIKKGSEEDKAMIAAILFHDSGKFATLSTDDNGIDHYYGHEEISAKEMEFLLVSPLDVKIYKMAQNIVKLHMKIHQDSSWRNLYKTFNLASKPFLLLVFHEVDKNGRHRSIVDAQRLLYIENLHSILHEWTKIMKVNIGSRFAERGYKGKQIGNLVDEWRRLHFKKYYKQMKGSDNE